MYKIWYIGSSDPVYRKQNWEVTMKANLFRMLRSGVAMLLALCMVVGFVPTAAFAAEDDCLAVVENVKLDLEELYKLVETYGPKAAEQVWKQWVKDGYVADVEEAISELKPMLEARYAYYTETALPAITKSVEGLCAQKDALTAELGNLNTELAAKKAELAEAIANVEIGSIHTPDIDIDVELGNNEQTQVPENEHAVNGEGIKAELEAAVEDLEHAIVTIEALIADIEADVADMIALAEQIAAAVAELEKTISDLAAAAEDVAQAVETIFDVVKNADGVVDATINSLAVARATADAALEVLNTTMGYAAQMEADLDVMIAKIAADAEALYNKFEEKLPGYIDQIPEDAYNVVGAAIVVAQQAYEANKAEIEQTLIAELNELAEEYGINEETILQQLAEIEGKIAEEINAKYAEVEGEFKAQIETAKAEAAAKLAALEEELKGYEAELAALAEDAAEEVRAAIQAQIDRVNADIATVNADLEHAVAHLEKAAEEAYEIIKAEVTKAYEEAVAALNAKLEELKAAYDKAVEELKATADKEIAELTAELNKLLEELGEIGEALATEINGILNAIREELAVVQKAIDEILKGNLAAVEDLKNAVIALGGEAIVEVVESLAETVEKLINEATTADLEITDTFKYVAIGDGSAETESYVESLTAALNAEAAANGVDEIEVVNYAKAGNTVADERVALSDVTDADLITVGFSNVEFLSEAVDTAINGGEFDWAAAVGAENVKYVDQLLAEVAAKIAEAGITGDIADMANDAIEAYAYSAVLYATELPELVNEIHAANEDALIIIVGMYNPMNGVSIALGNDVALDMDEYMGYLVKGVAVHGVAYSMLSGNSIYVDAPAVQTENTKSAFGIRDLYALMDSEYAALYPSAAGDAYITAQIADALDITYLSNPFIDVFPTDWYFDAVLWAAKNDITKGYGKPNTFCPNQACSRAEIVTFLWRANGCPAPSSTVNPFVDIEEGSWYYDAVLWACEQGITEGYGDNEHFAPNVTCDRAQVATFLHRAKGTPAVNNGANPFIDIKAGTWYTEAVLWAAENDITVGYGEANTFRPELTCTRAQIVTFLYRAYK